MKRKFSWWKMGLIILPFLVVITWILSGLFTSSEDIPNRQKGFNTVLPAAQISKDTVLDKLSFYAHATKDSVKRLEQLSMDPYRNKWVKEESYAIEETLPKEVQAIQKKMYQPFGDINQLPDEKRVVEVGSTVNHPKVQSDPDIEAIHATLDRIAALQKTVEPVGELGAVEEKKKLENVFIKEKNPETFFGKSSSARSGFLGDGSQAAEPDRGMRACIPYGQVVQPGSTVRVELSKAVQIGGVEVPAGTVLSGIAALNGERLHIQIPSVRIGAQVFPIELFVFDMDGLEGIYVPGSISREVLKHSADGAVQSIGISGFDASIQTQAISAGVGAAKGLLSRKVKAIRVNLPAGYPVLLMSKK